ncbi:MAG: hypothetical protein ACI35O_08555 [Bacillaceae bacterium]
MFFDEQNFNISQLNIYQMFAYSVRYKWNDIVLAYPKFLYDLQNELLINEFKIDNYDYTVLIKLIRIDIEVEAKLLAENIE